MKKIINSLFLALTCSTLLAENTIGNWIQNNKVLTGCIGAVSLGYGIFAGVLYNICQDNKNLRETIEKRQEAINALVDFKNKPDTLYSTPATVDKKINALENTIYTDVKKITEILAKHKECIELLEKAQPSYVKQETFKNAVQDVMVEHIDQIHKNTRANAAAIEFLTENIEVLHRNKADKAELRELNDSLSENIYEITSELHKKVSAHTDSINQLETEQKKQQTALKDHKEAFEIFKSSTTSNQDGVQQTLQQMNLTLNKKINQTTNMLKHTWCYLRVTKHIPGPYDSTSPLFNYHVDYKTIDQKMSSLCSPD